LVTSHHVNGRCATRVLGRTSAAANKPASVTYRLPRSRSTGPGASSRPWRPTYCAGYAWSAHWPRPNPRPCATDSCTPPLASCAANANQNPHPRNLALGRATTDMLPRRVRTASTDLMWISKHPALDPRITPRSRGTRSPPDATAGPTMNHILTTRSTNLHEDQHTREAHPPPPRMIKAS
jgi:hypothetical protein